MGSGGQYGANQANDRSCAVTAGSPSETEVPLLITISGMGTTTQPRWAMMREGCSRGNIAAMDRMLGNILQSNPPTTTEQL